MTHASGARIADYLLHEELPARSTEIAYRATHRVLPRCARLAIVSPAWAGSREAERSLIGEACVLETLHHSGVPRVFECGVFERRAWVASEHVTGSSIEDAAAERPLPISEALAVLRDAAAILAHAHRRGVVHRDLTPRSILRTPERGFPVCITGWGDASPDARAPPSEDPDARFYRAPELAAGHGGDGRADVFALGAVMFEAATLVLPDPVQQFPGVPAALHQLLARMLARDPAGRPTAAVAHAEAARLAELYSGSEAVIDAAIDAAIEEVELVDISRTQTPTNPSWLPPDHVATVKDHASDALHGRKDS